MSFELKPYHGTITKGGKACSTGGTGTVLCGRPIQRNTGWHEAEFKQTSNSGGENCFGVASATVDLQEWLGRQKGSAGLHTDGHFYTDRQHHGNVGGFGNQQPVTLAVDTDVAGALECVWSVGGSEKKRHPIEEGWRFAVSAYDAIGNSFEIVRYTVGPPFFLSHTQRDADAKLVAESIYGGLREAGKSAWLDVKMPKCDMQAMEDGVRNCKCFLAIVTDNGKDSYFSRDMCRKEIQWALDYGKVIVPVCDREDKQKIGDFIAESQKHGFNFGSYNFASFDRTGPRYSKASIDEIIAQAQM